MAGRNGGARPGAGRPKGSGKPLKYTLRELYQANRDVMNELVERIVHSSTNPMQTLWELSADKSISLDLRIQACRHLLPYLCAPVPSQVNVLHGRVDANELRRAMLQRLDSYAVASTPAMIEAKAQLATEDAD